MLHRSRRGGVPVFNRPHLEIDPPRHAASSVEGASPYRPSGFDTSPTWVRPLRNVPVVTTTAAQSSFRPPLSTTAETAAADLDVYHLIVNQREPGLRFEFVSNPL